MKSLLCVATLTALSLSSVSAQTIPGHCMASSNVKKPSFTLNNATMSCSLVEQRRVALMLQIEALPSTGDVDVAALGKQLEALESLIKQKRDAKDWKGITTAVTGEVLGTYGLAACVPSAGLGCAVGVIGKIMAMDALYDLAAKEDVKAKEIQALLAISTGLRKEIGGKSSPAGALRKRMVDEALQLCTAVKEKCL